MKITNKIYTFGGSCRGTCAHRYTLIFDIEKEEWQRGQELLIERKAHSSIFIGGSIYHFFGRSDNEFAK